MPTRCGSETWPIQTSRPARLAHRLLRFSMFDTVDLHNISNHALPDGLVVAVRAEHEEHVVRVVGVGRGHALVVDLRLVREGEVPLRLFQRREAALGTPRRERAGAQRAEGSGCQHRLLRLATVFEAARAPRAALAEQLGSAI